MPTLLMENRIKRVKGFAHAQLLGLERKFEMELHLRASVMGKVPNETDIKMWRMMHLHLCYCRLL